MSRLQAAVFQVLEGFTLSDDVRKILEAAYYADDTFTQGRAAGLEEVADRQLSAAYQTGMEGDDFDMLAAKRDIVKAARAISPTSSDAGKDDARDAARYRWLKAWGKTDGFSDEAIDREIQIDAAVSSLEVIGKGEKG